MNAFTNQTKCPNATGLTEATRDEFLEVLVHAQDKERYPTHAKGPLFQSLTKRGVARQRKGQQ